MTAVIVDWLGRGGSAAATRAWMRVAERHGADMTAVTVTGRDLTGPGVIGLNRPTLGGYSRHVDLVRLAAEYIERHGPKVVVLQNYVVPHQEQRVADAARSVGARLVIVAHTHRPDPMTWGSSFGLRRLLRSASVLVAHSEFVADRLTASSPRRLKVVPLPPPFLSVRTTDARTSEPVVLPSPAGPPRRALYLSTTRRRGRAMRAVAQLAKEGLAGWSFGAIEPEVLAASVADDPTGDRWPGIDRSSAVRADVVLLPYRRATQSRAAHAAQALGVVPVVTDVGGLGEQVHDNTTGLMLPAGATVESWRAALQRLEREAFRSQLSANCVARSQRDRDEFERAVASLVA